MQLQRVSQQPLQQPPGIALIIHCRCQVLHKGHVLLHLGPAAAAGVVFLQLLPAGLAVAVKGGQVVEAATLLAEALQAPVLHHLRRLGTQ
jgi:hypothetical protein